MSGPLPRSRLSVPALAAVLLLGLAPGPAPAAPDGPAPATRPAPSPVAPIRAAQGQQSGPGGGAAAARPAPKHRSTTARTRRPVSGPIATIALANAQARDWPTPDAYVNSALYYDFEPGRLYTVHTSPRFLTTIALKPGEKLIAKAAGDTVRWVIGETTAGAGETSQVVVFVKPIRPGLRTNLVLTTDQRTYLIDTVSNADGVYTAVLSWNYPQDLAKAAAAERARLEVQQASVVAGDVAVDRLNFRYRIDPKDRRPPPWTPVRVFDDGRKTYIEFPPDLATQTAPPLFLLGDKDRAELVNSRQAGVYYVVDRLIDRAELRIGEGRQSVVRITRQGGAQ